MKHHAMATLRFLSLDAIREYHNGLLDERADVADDSWSDEFIERINQFVKDVTESGAILEGYDKRSGAQRVLDYWIDQTFRQRRTREVARPTLAPFDAARAVAAEDLPEEAFPFGVFGAAPERPEDLLPSRLATAAECVERLKSEGLAVLVGPRASGRTGVALAGVAPLWLRGASDASAPTGSGERRILWYDRPSDVRWPLDDGTAETLVVIDHLEDLFDRAPQSPKQDAEPWLDQLGSALNDARFLRRYLLVIRRDALHHLEAASGIGSRVSACSTMLSPLEARELVEVIESRAKQVRLWFARGLVDQIVNDILGDPGALPWLRVALRELWNRRERNRIDWAAYDLLGGARLLERGLETYYEQADPAQQARIERLLNRLVLPGLREEDFQCVRLSESELLAHETDPAAMQDAIDGLIAHGLLSRTEPARTEPGSASAVGAVIAGGNAPIATTSDLGRDDATTAAGAEPRRASSRGPTLRVAHESFVPRWRRLTQWVAARRELLEDLLRLVDAAAAWRDSNQNVGALWIDQTLINDATKTLASAADLERNSLTGFTSGKLALAREFLARSQQYVNWRETLRRLRLAVATAAACVFGGLWLLSEHYRGQAIREQQAAERALGRAHRAERERILGEDDLSGALELLNDASRHRLAHDEHQPDEEDTSIALLRNQLATPSLSRLIQARGPYRPESGPARERRDADSGTGANATRDGSRDADRGATQGAVQSGVQSTDQSGGDDREDGGRDGGAQIGKHGAWIATALSPSGDVLVECYGRKLTVHRLRATGRSESRSLVVPMGMSAHPATIEFRGASVSADGRTIVAEVSERTNESPAHNSVTLRSVCVWRDCFDDRSVDRIEGVRLRLGEYESIHLATVRADRAAAPGQGNATDGAWLLAVCPLAVRNAAAPHMRELQIWQLNATAESPEPRIVASRVIELGSQEHVVTSSVLRYASSAGVTRFRVAIAVRDPGAGPAPLAVRVWEVIPESQSGEFARPVVLSTGCANITNVAWFPENQRFLAITGTRGGDLVELWRVDCPDESGETGATLRPLSGPQRVQAFADSRTLSFSGDGATFATGAKDAAILWRLERSAETGQITPRFLYRLPHAADVFAAAFSPDGRLVATGSRDRTVRLWNVVDGQQIIAPLRHTEVVTMLAFDERASFLATLDANFSSGDRTVRVWPLKSSNPPPTIVVNESADLLPVLSPDGRAIVRFREYNPLGGGSGPFAGAPRLETLDTPRTADVAGKPALDSRDIASRELKKARRARFSSNGDFLLTWCGPAKDVVDAAGDVLWEFRLYETDGQAHGAPAVIVLPRIPGPGPWRWADAIAPTAMAVSNRGERVAVAFAHGFGLADRDSQGVVWVWSRHGRTANRAADQGSWDSWSAWRAAVPDDTTMHRSQIVSMAFSPNGDRLATASSDDSVCIWSCEEKQHAEREALASLRHGADVNDVRYLSVNRGARFDGLVTASSDGKLRVWEHDVKYDSTALVREFSHRAPIQFGMMNHRGTLAISAGDDGRVKVWNAASGELTAVVQSGRYVRDLAMARDGTIWTVSQSPGRSVPPAKPIFPIGWSPVPGGALPMPAVIQAWRARSAEAATASANSSATPSAALATLLAARRFAKNGQLVDMTPVEYEEQWRQVRRARSAEAAEGAQSQETPAEAATSNDGLSEHEREHAARTVAECISRRDWYAARWHLDQWLVRSDARRTSASLVTAQILRAHVQASFAAEQFDGHQACREFAIATDSYQKILATPNLTAGNRTELWLRLGWLSEKLGNWDDARLRYTEAIEQAERNGGDDTEALAVWYRRRGTCFAELNEMDKAAADFEQSWRLAKADYWRSYEQLYCLALLALAKGNPNDRAVYARRCAELIDGHRKFRERATHSPSWTLLRETESANAVAALCALAPVASLNPDDAMTLAQQAVERNPDNYFIQSTLGGCRFRQAMRLGPLRSALVQARADLLAARMKYLAGRQTQLGADSIVGGVIQDDGTPYDWLFLAMVTWQLSELDRKAPKAQRNVRETNSLRDEALFWLEKARQQLRVPASLPRTPGRLPCAPATGWSWWQRMELQLLLREAETMLGTTGAD